MRAWAKRVIDHDIWCIPEPHWSLYREAMRLAAEREIPFALGGGFAVCCYTNRCRFSNDLDIYVLPESRERMIAITGELGLRDFFQVKPYDRAWIYRSSKDEIILDVMWMMANHRAVVDPAWLTRGALARANGETFRLLPPEEMIWDKLHVLQRDRCDWPDVLNLLYATGPELDWGHLIWRIGEDLPLLASLCGIFAWIAPGRAAQVPRAVWRKLHIKPPDPSGVPETDFQRVAALDRRPWFGPAASEEEAA